MGKKEERLPRGMKPFAFWIQCWLVTGPGVFAALSFWPVDLSDINFTGWMPQPFFSSDASWGISSDEEKASFASANKEKNTKRNIEKRQ